MKDCKLFGKIVLYAGIPFMLLIWAALAAVHKNDSANFDIGWKSLGIAALVLCVILWLLFRGDIDRKTLVKDTFKLVGLIFGGLVLLCVVMAGPWMMDSVRYAWIYSTNGDHVHAQKEPTDCDWGHAPIGDKGCHYEKQVAIKRHGNGQLSDVYVSWNKVQD